ncbi:Tumor necrosis factor receptor superfamily member 14 [Labeo rohita]|uniref:Tumor necrosis factor receptor superfamily member 14 n=1 Tax=Labeo rohita TaxID=84645 RepID=A0ABQ8MFS4_LABRO|nr:Tumor necrosis factor receptor superfamily member 14 [Labeo rohita]
MFVIILITLIFSLHYEFCFCQCSHAEYEIHEQCCPMCVPGYHVHLHCTDDTTTTCVPCTPLTFIDEANGLTRCFPCTMQLRIYLLQKNQGLRVNKVCTRSSDTVCGPQKGFYCIYKKKGSCRLALQHSECSPGQYIKQAGTDSTDTVCADCTGDSYSNGSFSSCLPHTKCEALGLAETNPGTHSSDSECRDPPAVAVIVSVLIIQCVNLCQVFTVLSNCKKAIKHSICSPGQYINQTGQSVITQTGTEFSDTVCDDCPVGSYSKGTICKLYTKCGSLGRSTVRGGTETSDAECRNEAPHLLTVILPVCGVCALFVIIHYYLSFVWQHAIMQNMKLIESVAPCVIQVCVILHSLPQHIYERVKKHCDENTSTTCDSCPAMTYTDAPNGLTECLSCFVCDSSNGLRVKQACTPISNTVCEPLSGFYCIDLLSNCKKAMKHSTCSPGQYVNQTGTEFSDTVCDDCPAGSYSDGTFCKLHTKCESLGKTTVKAGTETSDVECSNGTPYLQIVIPSVFVFVVIVIIAIIIIIQRKKKPYSAAYEVTPPQDVDQTTRTNTTEAEVVVVVIMDKVHHPVERFVFEILVSSACSSAEIYVTMITLSITVVLVIVLLNYELSACGCGRAEYEINNQCCPMCSPGMTAPKNAYLKQTCTASVGNHVHWDCTDDTSTTCAPCPEFTFSDEPNGLMKCFPCTVCDASQGLRVNKACTQSSDTVCEPLEKFYCINKMKGSCILAVQHLECSPGQYIKQAGTGSTDTICADCTGDTYSNGSFSSCLPHTKCEDMGSTETNPGTYSSDTECAVPYTAAASFALSVIVVLILIAVISIVTVIWKKKQSQNSVCEPLPGYYCIDSAVQRPRDINPAHLDNTLTKLVSLLSFKHLYYTSIKTIL